MRELTDQFIIFLCCVTLYSFSRNDNYAIIPILFILSFICFSIYFNQEKLTCFFYLGYLGICFFYPAYLLFFPVMIYHILFSSYKNALFAFFIPFVSNNHAYTLAELIFCFIFFLLCLWLKQKTLCYEKLLINYNKLKENSSYISFLQEEKNRSILENQDYEINVATLNERNRISREIHDNIGHLLSRSLLQIGALLIITKEEIVKNGLSDLKKSLSEGMDSIRASIHNMHDESIDLYTTIDGLVKNFTFCQIYFDYDIETSPLLKIKYCFIAIVKEALNNITKHSNATYVSILLKEQPALYQLIISDNGTVDKQTKTLLNYYQNNQQQYQEGMGIQNIIDRVKGFQGNILITGENGFQLFITIPKNQNNN